jgi:hypothetical protein
MLGFLLPLGEIFFTLSTLWFLSVSIFFFMLSFNKETESKNANKDNKTEIIVKSHERCVQDSTPNKTKTTQRKKKFTPFGGKRK